MNGEDFWPKRRLIGLGVLLGLLGVAQLEPALNAVFKAIPVYRLRDDWKGTAARAVLLSIRTDGHDLVATLDPVGEAIRLLAGAAIFVLPLYTVLCLVAPFTSWLGGWANGLLFWG